LRNPSRAPAEVPLLRGLATAALLADYRPIAVVAGAEQGVELADALCEATGLPGNGTALSHARRTKDVQTRTVAAAGLPTARQLTVEDAAQLEGGTRGWAGGSWSNRSAAPATTR
jgi:hypothetical protein